jgi:LysM repeat protein
MIHWINNSRNSALTAFALCALMMPIQAQSQSPVQVSNEPANAQPQPPTVATEMVIELEHKVKKGETLYAIGKHYHCSVAELQALNPGIGMLKPGMKVKVKQRTKMPAKSAPVTAPQLNPLADRKKEVPVAIATLPEVPENVIDHVVEKGQSLYSISKKYGVSIAEIKTVNKLNSDQLSINQKLWIPNKTVKAEAIATNGTPKLVESPNAVSTLDSAAKIATNVAVELPETPAANAGVSIKDSMENQGGMPEQVATKLKSSNLKEYEKKVTAQIGYEGMKADRSWVMLNKHKKGEVVAVINPVNKKMVYCTVIGDLPDKGNKHIAISQSVADRLGITEANATLRVRYVAQ